MDKIILHNLEVAARVGVTRAERAQPQRLLIHVELSLDLTRAGQADALDTTVDYAAAAAAVRAALDGREYVLLEAVTRDVIESMWQWPLVQAVEVEARKFSVPGTAHVAVNMTRQRA
jgi:dihydroneopterin aldolase